MNENLKKIQQIELDILIEVDRICKKYEIEYFLDFGTLLGAVRHHGFIPWDDDIDIGMTRDNYEKFLKIASSELKEDYFLQNVHTEKETPFLYSKIRKNGTLYLQNSLKKLKIHHGIFIDIFPYDYFPEVSKNKIKFFKLMNKMHRLVSVPERVVISDNTLKWKIISGIRNKLYKISNFLFSKEKLERVIDKAMKKYSSNNSNFVMCCLIPRPTPILLKNMYPFEYIAYEGIKFPVIQNREEYLTKIYGDYMKLPKESERRGHEVVKVSYE